MNWTEHRARRVERRETLVSDVLSDVFAVLATAPDSPRRRALYAHARFYGHTVKRWASVPPSAEQISAMLEIVTALHVEALVSAEQGRGSSSA